MHKYKIFSIILLIIIILLSPILAIFIFDHIRTQSVNIRKSNEWIAYNFNELAKIYEQDKNFEVGMYTGNNGCVRIKFNIDEKDAESTLNKILKIEHNIDLLIEYPNYKVKIIKGFG